MVPYLTLFNLLLRGKSMHSFALDIKTEEPSPRLYNDCLARIRCSPPISRGQNKSGRQQCRRSPLFCLQQAIKMAIDQKMTDDHVGSICGFTPSLYIRQRLLKMSLEVFLSPLTVYTTWASENVTGTLRTLLFLWRRKELLYVFDVMFPPFPGSASHAINI